MNHNYNTNLALFVFATLIWSSTQTQTKRAEEASA